MKYKNILIEKKAPLTTVIINRLAVRNAVNLATAKELHHAFRAFDADPTMKVGVLCGAGNTFCAGADLKAMTNDPTAMKAYQQLFDSQEHAPLGTSYLLLSKPVIAAVEGFAVAGGLELALWCDLRVVGESAVMGVYCRRWGVPLIDGGTVRLPRLIGLSRALDLILTGRGVGASEALTMGLANRIVADGEARAAAENLALQIANFPQICLQNDRRSAYEQQHLPLKEALQNELKHGIRSIASGETAKGAMRFTKS